MINESVFQRYLPEFEGRGKTISQYMVPSYYWLGWGIKGNREIYAHDYHAKLVRELDEWSFGGLDKNPINVLRLLSELEGSSQLLKYMGFQEDMETIDEMKKRYYKLYFKLKRGHVNPIVKRI